MLYRLKAGTTKRSAENVSQISAATIRKVQQFAECGGTTPHETHHVRRIAEQLSRSSCPNSCPPSLASTQAAASQNAGARGNVTSVPIIPTSPWTEPEMKAAKKILAGAKWPSFGPANDIYAHAQNGADKTIPMESILAEARLLQLALLKSKKEGHFDRLTNLLKEGLQGMETLVMARYYRSQHMERFYEKTAGDMLQTYWSRKYLRNMVDCFQHNPIQAEIAIWLQLPRLVLPLDMADKIMEKWNEHHIADFQEQLSLYLPTELLNIYMLISVNYYRLFVKTDKDIRLCEYRDEYGLLCCDKHSRPGWPRFCSYTHYNDRRLRVLESFCADDYGKEYLCVEKNDMVSLHPHEEEGHGWSFARHMRTMKYGWIPTEFVMSQ